MSQSIHTFVVITGQNTGTGAGILEKLAETAGVNTAVRYSVFLCAFFARLIKLGRQQENRGAKNHRNVNGTHTRYPHTRKQKYQRYSHGTHTLIVLTYATL